MRVEPEGVMLLVKPDAVEKQTSGGIYLPEVAKDRKQLEGTMGTIVELGPATQIEFNGEDAKEGDHILFAKYAGYIMEDKDTGEDFRIIDHKDVIARVG